MNWMAFPLYHKMASQLSSIAAKKSFWWIALVVFFLPFLFLAFFNHPSVDDYCYVVMVKKSGYWQAQYDSYMTWSGRYAATFFLVSNPLVFGFFLGYQLINVVLLILTVVSVFYFVKKILNKNSIDLSVITISVAFLFLYLSKMPTLTEGFFWLAGAITYQLANIATLALVGELLNPTKNKREKLKLTGLILICVLICGLNETSMLELLYILVALMALEYASMKTIPKYYVALLAVSVAATLLVLLAPGNEIRASYFTGNKDFLLSFASALNASFFCLQDWLQDVLIVLVLFIPFLRQTDSDRTVTSTILLMYPLFIFGILVVGYFPAFWSMGGAPPARTLNVVYFLFIASCLHYANLWICYVKQNNGSLIAVPLYVQWVLIFILIVHVAPVNNFRTAVMDLVSGRAFVYDRAMRARYQYLDQHKGKNITLEPLQVKPKSIFLTDIEPLHPEDWKNVCMADYFYIRSLNLNKTAE